MHSLSLNSLLTLLTIIALSSCDQKNDAGNLKNESVEEKDPGSLTSKPLSPSGTNDSPTLFTRLSPEDSGVDFTHLIDLSHPLKRLYFGSYVTGGIAIGDVNGDGLPDLYFVNGPSKNALYRNLGNFKFTEVESPVLTGGEAWGTGTAMADIDNDGDLDLYVCNYQSPNQLFINEGEFKFTERAAEFGLDFEDASIMPSFCDYDNDGDLDCFVLTNRIFRDGGWPQEERFERINGRVVIKEKYSDFYRVGQIGEENGKPKITVFYAGRRNRLFRNEEGKQFKDVSYDSGISGRGHGLSATWWDADNDGLMDLYVGNDFHDPDQFYRNQGDGTFKDVVKESVPHTTWFSMGADFADLDNDALFDFLIVDMSSRTHFNQKLMMGSMSNNQWFLENAEPRQYMRNALYLNTGTPRFKESAYLSKLADTDWTWAVKLADFDNDGRNDAYFTNGVQRNFSDSDQNQNPGNPRGRNQWADYEDGPKREEQNLAFRNEGNLKFSDVSAQWGLDHTGVSYAAAVGDLDGDGDLDIVVNNLEEPVSIYRNNAPTPGTIIDLRGTDSNHFGFGAKLEITTSSGTQVRQLSPATGFLSSNEPHLHFGTAEKVIDRLTVRWPGGNVQQFENLDAGKRYLIQEGDHGISSPPPSPPLLKEQTKPANTFVHQELPFDDYATQPLLANKLSQLGPGIATNNEMVWIGGARGEPGEVWSNGKLLFRDSANAASEDMGALFFDANGDGLDDLYVVSGGVEEKAGRAMFRDRLLLFQGNDKGFKESSLPDIRDSGGPVVSADFDRDGDLDLFIGGRVVPTAYPSTPESRLLVNDGGSFTEMTDQLALGLRRSGMVTSAVWSDVDNDGWIDLLVAHDWGPIKVWKNTKGELRDQSTNSGTANLLGWWNSITPGDFDGDGDMDYALGNVGLNTKYEAPAYVYYGDFDGTGVNRIVEAEVEGDIVYPVRGKSCTSAAIPIINHRFKTYREFAGASLQKIFTANALDKAQKLEANTLSSGWLRNNGEGSFDFVPFADSIAQIAPVFGTVANDFNGDGNMDLFLAQNFYSPQAETGRMDGGISTLLLGDGAGNFKSLRPDQSGISISADAKSAAIFGSQLIVGVNDGAPRFFDLQDPSTKALVVRLRGLPGNPHGVGARVTHFAESPETPAGTNEITAGSGYLSQSSPELRLYSPEIITKLQIRWPNGTISEFKDIPEYGLFEATQPTE